MGEESPGQADLKSSGVWEHQSQGMVGCGAGLMMDSRKGSSGCFFPSPESISQVQSSQVRCQGVPLWVSDKVAEKVLYAEDSELTADSLLPLLQQHLPRDQLCCNSHDPVQLFLF